MRITRKNELTGGLQNLNLAPLVGILSKKGLKTNS